MNDSIRALQKIKNKEVVLFSISGKMASGKDTVGELVSEKLREKGYDLVNVSFGTLIRKEIDSVIWDYKYSEELSNATSEEIEKLIEILHGDSIHERSERSRKALQFWGTEVRRKQNYSYWIDKMASFALESANAGISVNITDSRFPNEVELVELLHGKVVRLTISKETQMDRIFKRDNINPTEESLNHSSEIALDDFDFERTFNGEKSLDLLSEEIINYLLEEK